MPTSVGIFITIQGQWADCNTTGEPVLMCDGSQFLCVNRTSIHYPRQCGCLETLPLWVYRLYSRNRLSVEWSNLLSNTLMTTRDTEVVLKIVIGRVRYRAQKRRQPNTYGREARATRMKRSRHPFFGCRSDSTIWMNKNPLERDLSRFEGEISCELTKAKQPMLSNIATLWILWHIMTKTCQRKLGLGRCIYSN